MGKAAYLLAHDQEREKIAYAGQKIMLAEYAIYHQAKGLIRS